MSRFANTPEPPYYAVIFTSLRTEEEKGYEEMAARMESLVSEQPGFLGVESVRGQDGTGITISYWSSLEAIKGWKEQAQHQVAQRMGKSVWYEGYITRICKVERAYSFESDK